MPNLRSDCLPSFIRSERKCSLTDLIRGISLLRQRQTAIFDVAIVRVNKARKIWILDSLGKLSMKLVDSDLEALAFTFLESHSYIRSSLKLVRISNQGIRATLSYSQQMGQRLTSASTTLYPVGLTKCCGHGGEKQDLENPPY